MPSPFRDRPSAVRDALAAIEWLCRVFGFERRAVYTNDNIVMHAELTLGKGMIMLGSVDNKTPYSSLIRQPRDVGDQNLGYDVESAIPNTGLLRFIEVKGRVRGAKTVTVTKNEILTGLNKPDEFILAGRAQVAGDDAADRSEHRCGRQVDNAEVRARALE